MHATRNLYISMAYMNATENGFPENMKRKKQTKLDCACIIISQLVTKMIYFHNNYVYAANTIHPRRVPTYNTLLESP